MAQIYRIYINDCTLILAETMPDTADGFQPLDKQGFLFDDFYSHANNGITKGVYFLQSNNPKAQFKKIKKKVKVIKAAGGLVRNEENRYLFIFRKGKWDLPKGKIDPGEKTKATALREVEEECGIKVSECGDLVCKTWHVYEMDGRRILKKTNWYHMFAKGRQKPVPQVEEDITDVKWLAPGDFMLVKQNTYPLIKDVIRVAEG